MSNKLPRQYLKTYSYTDYFNLNFTSDGSSFRPTILG